MRYGVIDLTDEACSTPGATSGRDGNWLLEAVAAERARFLAAKRAEARTIRAIAEAEDAMRGVGRPVPRPRPIYEPEDAFVAPASAPRRPRGRATTDPATLALRREAKRARDREYQRQRRIRMRQERLRIRDSEDLMDFEPIPAAEEVSVAETARADVAESEDGERSGFECPVCFRGTKNVNFCSIACGHVFCSECISKVLATKPCCPKCRATTRPSDVRRLFI